MTGIPWRRYFPTRYPGIFGDGRCPPRFGSSRRTSARRHTAEVSRRRRQRFVSWSPWSSSRSAPSSSLESRLTRVRRRSSDHVPTPSVGHRAGGERSQCCERDRFAVDNRKENGDKRDQTTVPAALLPTRTVTRSHHVLPRKGPTPLCCERRASEECAHGGSRRSPG